MSLSLTSPVAVLLGGTSDEREISLQSGRAVLDALLKKQIDAVAIDTAESGWIQAVADNFQHVFIALHGINGEDGTVQGLLEMLGVTYTGSGVMASALAMDKLRTKQLWNGIGLPTADFEVLSPVTDWAAIMGRWQAAIVKPAREGSSIGMTKVTTAQELAQAYQLASEFDKSVFAEECIVGAEFTVAVIDGKALPAIRLETDNVFYDYDAKYLSDETRYLCPCGLSVEKENELKGLAERAFESLGCKGWGRVDFMQDSLGNFYALEVNTVPGMTSHSLVPMAAKAVGINFEELVVKILQLSLVK